MKNLNIISLFLIFLLFNQCKKDSPTVGIIPKIKILSISKDTIKQFKDSLIVELEYTDGDGNIGEDNPDKNSLMIHDKRLVNPDFYFVKPQSPPGKEITVKGVIRVYIKNMFLLGGSNSEITNLDIKLRDRAGQWSNNVQSPKITIVK